MIALLAFAIYSLNFTFIAMIYHCQTTMYQAQAWIGFQANLDQF